MRLKFKAVFAAALACLAVPALAQEDAAAPSVAARAVLRFGRGRLRTLRIPMLPSS